MENNNKKTLILSIVGILVLVIAVVGVSFAMYSFTGTGTKENVITEYYQMGYATDLETMRPSGKIYKYKGKHLKDNLEGQE